MIYTIRIVTTNRRLLIHKGRLVVHAEYGVDMILALIESVLSKVGVVYYMIAVYRIVIMLNRIVGMAIVVFVLSASLSLN